MIELQTVRSMLMGFAVGDALGVPVEFISRARLRQNPVTGMRDGGAWGQPAGTWSDDTSMTLATMESIGRLKKIELDDIMNNFVKWIEHDEFTANNICFDVGNTTAAAIENYLNGAALGDCGLKTPGSNGNGSLMRILPVALYTDSLETIHSVSSLTHAHARSLIACGIYSLVVKELLKGKPMNDAIAIGLTKAENYYRHSDYAIELTNFKRLFDPAFGALDEFEISSGGYVLDTLETVIWCALNTNNYRDLVLKAVNLGGDTDTVGAIAGGLGGIAYGLDQIPADWLDTLRNKKLLEEIAASFCNAL